MTWIIDDQHLGELLRTGRPPQGVRRSDDIFTTGYWYVRLCRALFGAEISAGVLSREFSQLPADLRSRALARVVELPADVGLVSLRELAPLIGRLRANHELNVLASEALAASVHLDARVLLSAPFPRLETALAAEGRRYITRAPHRS